MRTFEVVMGGHPDKVCDIIAEAIKAKAGRRSAVEVAWFNQKIIVGGEISHKLSNQVVEDAAREVLYSLGYNEPIEIENMLQAQSREINEIVGDSGAGDNGVFFAGYHKYWTPIIDKLKLISKRLTLAAKNYNYRTDGKFIAVFDDAYMLVDFTLNIASHENQSNEDRKAFDLYLRAMLDLAFNKTYNLYINPKGRWYKCGGFADSGLTGRKLACDNSLGLFHQGSGAFFGKDASKADYSVPLYLQNMAKKVAASGNYLEVELRAHTIIGDDKVDIYHHDRLIDTVDYKIIMDYARAYPMEWVGL